MQRFITLAFSTLLLLSLNAATPETHYTVIVSLDGFRWDYPDMYKTPNLNRMAADGVKAVMLPSYPASTFPNHYTLATGLVPDHHGIINNTFWDVKNRRQYSMGDSATRNNPEYYFGEPIWITAQKQGIKTGNMYWVGSDIAIKKSHPTYYKPWNAKPFLTFKQRIDTVLTWLQKPEPERPRLIMLYFEEPDGSGHHNGPCSLPTGAVVQHMDSLVGGIKKKDRSSSFRRGHQSYRHVGPRHDRHQSRTGCQHKRLCKTGMVRSDRRTYTNFHILETGIPRLYLQCSEKSGSHPCVEKRRDSRRTALWQQRPYRRYRSGSGTGLAVYGRGTRHQRRSRIFSPKPRHAGYVSGHRT